MTYRTLDLFSGIGGFSLGLERTGGFRTVAFCEIEPFCRRVLAKHWPEVPCYDDVRTLTADRLRADGIAVDAICGGFPCQDISYVGAGAGIDGERSGLWSEYARLVGELRPRYVLVENVAALLSRGLDRVLGDLAALGFDAEWHCVPASAIGAPHRRDRLWLVAYPHREGQPGVALYEEMARRLADAAWHVLPQQEARGAERQRARARSESQSGADPARVGWRETVGAFDSATGSGETAGQSARRDAPIGREWLVEPDVGRVAYGLPARVDRLRSLGNAVVPQIPELIGRAILAAEQARAA